MTQVLALAIQLDDMIRRGEAASFADLARLGCLTCERISQIMKLLWLAPEIQREILSLPHTHRRFPVGEVAARRIAETPLWDEQNEAWRKLKEINRLA
ncbi:MAG: hypothetical protein HY820_04510 [Acidobacteria bacterium]|nr:hypothetical protein [Acidobacteriota bacterium]